LICRAWADSFAKKTTNLHAISDRGWYHLDMRLLHDPDILQTKVTEVTSPDDCYLAAASGTIRRSEASVSSSSHISDLTLDDDDYDPIGSLGLNMHQGAACDITADVVRHLKRNISVHVAFRKKKAEGEAVKERFEEFVGDSRMTSGVMYKAKKVLLGQDILGYRRGKEQANLSAKLATIKTAALKYHKRFKTYTDLMESGYATTNEKRVNK
jgi:hypothetical protein